MLRSIKKLIGDKGRQLIVPIVLMSLDAIGSLVMYLMLYFTVVHLLSGTLSGALVRNYTIVCLVSVILRLLIYRSGYFLCFSRGAKMCSDLRLQLANHYRSLSLGYFNQNSSGYLLTTLTKDLSNFELVLTHTLPSIIKTLVMGVLILAGTFFINWKLALAECVVILIALPILHQGNTLVEKYGKMKRDLTSKMVSIVLEYIKGMKVFKSANMTSTHFARMSDTLEDIRKTNVQAEVKTAVPTSMYSIVANFLLPFVLLIGSYLFLGGAIASEQLVAFMLMSLALSALLIAFEHSYGLLKELRLATSNLEQAFDTKSLPYKEEQVILKHFDVAFDHVSFSYNLQTEVLHDISFYAKEGSTTALIGPSGSGKSTVAGALEEALHKLGVSTYLLDGDNVRHGLCSDLGFSDADRKENIRRVGEVANLMVDAGLVVLTAFISPHRAERKMVRERVGEGRFIEVFVDTPLATCEARDPKGLYKKARAGELRNFTGIDSVYEAPESPEIHLDGEQLVTNLVPQLLDLLRQEDIIRS